jgi:calpain-15
LGFVCSLMLCPFLLVWQSMRIYLLPCLCAYSLRCCCFVACKLCTCRCWLFKDLSFPQSLGSCKAAQDKKIVWKRAAELCEGKQGMRLFERGIAAEDICQGGLGDCWLLSALVCLAEFPGAIESVFDNVQISMRGKYSLRLFDANQRRFIRVTVDDFVPIDEATGEPCFAKPNGAEVWVMLLGTSDTTPHPLLTTTPYPLLTTTPHHYSSPSTHHYSSLHPLFTPLLSHHRESLRKVLWRIC